MKIIDLNHYRATKAREDEIDRLTALLLTELENEVVDFSLIAKLQNEGADVNQANNLGWTALQLACTKGDIDMVKKMLKIGANVNQADTSGWGPLHEACYYGHFELTKTLLQSGANPNQVLSKDDLRRPFDLASSQGHLNIVLILPFNFTDIHRSWSPLHIAAYHGDITTIKKSKCDIDNTNAYDWTPFRLAALNGQAEAINALIQQGAFVHQVNHNGRTALHFAAFYNHVDAAREIIRHGLEVDIQDGRGQTPLHSTCLSMWSPLAAVKELILLGANIDFQDFEGKTPLHHAVLQSSTSSLVVAKFLIEHSANVNAQDNNGDTPLHFCRFTAREKAIPFAQLLIEQGADKNMPNYQNVSPKAIFEGNPSSNSKAILQLMS
ncbi:MAG: ankyrin repeat domain-containing protein [Gammaproteobacteria bacterium]|jgi:ankyrin repeat protein|nr:ankyrin repeat domain-containing protein [Gammaproteobacteria bacterium]